MASALLALVICGVCCETYTEHGDNVPLNLPCGHTYCHSCLDALPLPKKCPSCRVPIGDDTPIASLPHNYPLLSMLMPALQLAQQQQTNNSENEHLLLEEHEEDLPPAPQPVLKRGVSSMTDEELMTFMKQRHEQEARVRAQMALLTSRKVAIAQERDELLQAVVDLHAETRTLKDQRDVMQREHEAALARLAASEVLVETRLLEKSQREAVLVQQEADIDEQIEAVAASSGSGGDITPSSQQAMAAQGQGAKARGGGEGGGGGGDSVEGGGGAALFRAKLKALREAKGSAATAAAPARSTIARFDTPKKDEQAPAGVSKQIIAATCNNDVGTLIRLCRVWAGNVVIDGFRLINDWSPLMWASDMGFEECLVCLIAAGGNVDAVEADGWTPMHCAASKNHPSVILILLAEKANAMALTKDGKTPLKLAQERKNQEAIALLQQHGV